MKTEYLNETGLYQSVEDYQIEFAKEKVNGDLQLMTVNDYYNGRRIEKVTFEENLPEDVENNLITKQAILFHLSLP